MRGNVAFLAWGWWVVASVFSSPRAWAGDLPAPALDVPVDVDGDGISSFGDVWVFNWWLSQGADAKDVLGRASVHDGLLDLSEYFRDRQAPSGEGGGGPGILGATSSCNWAGEAPSTTRMPPNWMTTNGQQPTGNTSEHARITPSGCFVVFASAAENLRGANGNRQIYRLEYRNGEPYGQLEHVSVMAATGASANGDCYRPSLSDDGNLVAFESYSEMELPGERQRRQPSYDNRDIFLRNVSAGTTARVSQNVAQEAPDGPSYFSAISGDGLWVAFTSPATDFGEEYPWDPDKLRKYVFRATTNAPAGAECVSVGPNGQGQDVLADYDMQTAEAQRGGRGSVGHVISPDGTSVAFYGKTALWQDASGQYQEVFVRDLRDPEAKHTWLVSPYVPSGHSKSPSISLPPGGGEGHIEVAYSTLDEDETPNVEDVYAVDLSLTDGVLNDLEKISQIGNTHGNGNSIVPVLSRSGLYVAFASLASNLVPNDTNGDRDVFLKRSFIWASEAMRRSSVKSDGSQADDGAISRESTSPDVTEDGAVVVFESTQRNLVPDDTNGYRDVFRRYHPWLTRFVRADANDDGTVNAADPSFILNYLFLGGDEPHCLDSADADDNGQVNMSDPIYILNFLFQGGPEPPPPFPGCGEDPTGDQVTCNAFENCAQ